MLDVSSCPVRVMEREPAMGPMDGHTPVMMGRIVEPLVMSVRSVRMR